MSDYLYIDPRGRRSGPYTEAELKLLSARGLLEPDGSLEIAGLSTSWRVADVPWLRSDSAAARTPTTGIADAPTAPPPDALAGDPEARVTIPPTASQPTDPPPQPTAIPVAGEPQRPLGTPPASIGGVGSTDQPACSRTVYVLLAILPAFLGIFGIHNLVAGYFSRGIVMLVLSVFTFMGACMVVAPPCLCLGIPLWIVLFVLSVVEAITVTSDARGRAFV
jgi:hypothetical protein